MEVACWQHDAPSRAGLKSDRVAVEVASLVYFPLDTVTTPLRVSRPLGSRGFLSRVRGSNDVAEGNPFFLELPTNIVKEVGWTYDRGPLVDQLRYDLAVLSYFGACWKLSRGKQVLVRYHDGVEIEIDDLEMVASIAGATRAIWQKLHLRPLPSKGLDDPEFRRFYDLIKVTVSRLEKTDVAGTKLLYRLGPARPDRRGKASDLFGLRWTMAGTLLDRHVNELGFCEPPLLLPSTRRSHFFLDTTYVEGTSIALNVVAYYQQQLRFEKQWATEFVEAAGLSAWAFRQRHKPVAYLKWQRQAQKTTLPRHVSIGAWRGGQATGVSRHYAPCMVPYLVADIDAISAAESYSCALLLLDRLKELGAPLNQIVVSFTGRRSFHVRIPHCLLDRPIYKDVSAARRVIYHFFRLLLADVLGPNGPLIDVIDANLFDPTHLVRAIGSEHADARRRYCVGFTGEEILGDPEYGAYPLSGIVEHSLRRTSFELPDPGHGDSCDLLLELLNHATQVVESERTPRSAHQSLGIIERIKQGIREGEMFHPEHTGRNKAAYLYALYLLTHGESPTSTARELAEWNEKYNLPPLSQRELKQVQTGAQRTMRRLNHPACARA